MAADTTSPTVAISSEASAPVTGPFPIAVAFSEPVTGFELDDLIVGNGTASELQGDNASYTATVTPTASGTVTVDIATGAAQDAAGNPSAAADQFSVIADLTPVPALPLAGAIVLALLLMIRGARQRRSGGLPRAATGAVPSYVLGHLRRRSPGADASSEALHGNGRTRPRGRNAVADVRHGDRLAATTFRPGPYRPVPAGCPPYPLR